MTYDLVIFDCDGVLVNSEPIANRVLAERLRMVGLTLSPDEIMERFIGRSRNGCLSLAAELLSRELPDQFAQDWDSALFAALEREVKPIDGVANLLARLEIPYCVASNSSPERMQISLRASGLLPLFSDRMFSSVDVPSPKPAPDLFLHAAKTLGAAPSRCAVVEDTATGVRAGVAAQMKVFGFVGGEHTSASALMLEGASTFERMSDLAALLSPVRRVGIDA